VTVVFVFCSSVLQGSDFEVMNVHGVGKKKLTINKKLKIIQVVEKNHTVLQNEIGIVLCCSSHK
jgi:hypothetical protein